MSDVLSFPNFVRDFLAGGLGGGASLLVGHPFDTIKVRLQTGGTSQRAITCLLTVTKNEGVLALYKGLLPPMLGQACINSIVFSSYNVCLRYLSHVDRHNQPARNHALAGAFAGIVQTLVCSPMELSKVLLQVQKDHVKSARASRELTSPIDVYRKLYRRRGLRGLTSGFNSCLWRDGIGFAMYFYSYHEICRCLTPVDGNLSDVRIMAAGGFAGMISWTLCFPFDVAKSRIQAEALKKSPNYNGVMDCLTKSVKSDGVRVLFKGFVPFQMRAFPTNAVLFYVYESTDKFLKRHFF